MKTLIALDGSAEATRALRTAAHLVSPLEREITLLCVAQPISRRMKGQPRDAWSRKMLTEANRILDTAHKDLPPGAGVVHRVAEVGSPASVIVDKARDFDLVVLGDKGSGTSGDPGLGPVASRVLEHAPCAVLIARDLPLSAEGLRVLVAADGAAASREAIETLCTAFDLGEVEVCVMHVVETPWVHLGLEEDWVSASEEEQDRSEPGAFEREMVREGEWIVEEAKRGLRIPRITIRTSIVQGNPASEILSEAERGDYHLIVIGASGSRDLKHQMVGSVSAKVAWNAPCSVLVVREPAETG
ncbi:MAG: universal stress protein [Bryobacteraceae bacterium]